MNRRACSPVLITAVLLASAAGADDEAPAPKELGEKKGSPVEVLRARLRETERWLAEASKPATKPEARARARRNLDLVEDRVHRAVLVRRLFLGAPAERQLAAELLATRPPEKVTIRGLSYAAIADASVPVRDRAIASLTSLNHAETGLFIADALRGRPQERRRAIEALLVFPHVGAVPALMDPSTLKAGESGFHRAHIFVGTERAYVSGWELATGGSGLVVGEVARPVTDTQRDGVVSEVNVRYIEEVEWVERTRTLRFLTGESHMKPAEWKAWWATAKATFQLSPEARDVIERRGKTP